MSTPVVVTSNTSIETIQGWNQDEVQGLLGSQLKFKPNLASTRTVFFMLTSTQVGWLQLGQIVGSAGVGIANVPQSQVQYLSLGVIGGLTATDFSSNTAHIAFGYSGDGARLLSLLRPNQAYAIKPTVIRDFTIVDFRSEIDANILSTARPKLLSCLSDSHVGFIDSAVIQGMSETDFTTRIGGVNASGVVTPVGGGALVTKLIGNDPPAGMVNQIRLLTAAQLTPAVLGLMNRAQIQAINPGIISQLSTTQLQTICASGDPVSTQLSVSNGQLDNVTARQLNDTGSAYWTPEQIEKVLGQSLGLSLSVGFLAGLAYYGSVVRPVGNVIAEAANALAAARAVAAANAAENLARQAFQATQARLAVARAGENAAELAAAEAEHAAAAAELGGAIEAAQLAALNAVPFGLTVFMAIVVGTVSAQAAGAVSLAYIIATLPESEARRLSDLTGINLIDTDGQVLTLNQINSKSVYTKSGISASVTDEAGGGLIAMLSNDTLNLSAKNTSVNAIGTGDLINLTNSNATLNLSANATTVNAFGTGDVVNVTGNTGGASFQGRGLTINAKAAGILNLYGTTDAYTVNATAWSVQAYLKGVGTRAVMTGYFGYAYLTANNQTLTLNNAMSGSVVYIADNLSGVTVDDSSTPYWYYQDTLYLGANTSLNLSAKNTTVNAVGDGGVINLTNSNATLTLSANATTVNAVGTGDLVNITGNLGGASFYGRGLTINAKAAGVLNLYGTTDAYAVNASAWSVQTYLKGVGTRVVMTGYFGYAYLTANNQTLTLNNAMSGSVVYIADNLSGVTVDDSSTPYWYYQDTLYLGVNTSLNLSAKNTTVNAVGAGGVIKITNSNATLTLSTNNTTIEASQLGGVVNIISNTNGASFEGKGLTINAKVAGILNLYGSRSIYTDVAYNVNASAWSVQTYLKGVGTRAVMTGYFGYAYLTANNQTLTLNNAMSGSVVYIADNLSGLTVNDSSTPYWYYQDTLYLGANTSLNLSAKNTTVNAAGTGDVVNITGNPGGASFYGRGLTINANVAGILNLYGTTDAYTVNASAWSVQTYLKGVGTRAVMTGYFGYAYLTANNQTLTLNNAMSGSVVYIADNLSGLTVDDSSTPYWYYQDTLYLGANTSLNLSAKNTTVNAVGAGGVINLTNSNATLTLSANATTVNAVGTGNTVNLTSGTANYANFSGNALHINHQASWKHAVLSGTSGTYFANATVGGAYFILTGNGTAANLTGTSAFVYLNANNQTLKLFSLVGSIITTGSNLSGLTVIDNTPTDDINGYRNTLNLGANTTLNLSAKNTTVNATGAGGVVTIASNSQGVASFDGQALTINQQASRMPAVLLGTSGTYTANAAVGDAYFLLGGNGTSAKLTGTFAKVFLDNNNQTLRLNGLIGSTVNIGGNLSGLTVIDNTTTDDINGNRNTVNLGASTTLNLSANSTKVNAVGTGVTVNLTNDGGIATISGVAGVVSTINTKGYRQQVILDQSSGDVIVDQIGGLKLSATEESSEYIFGQEGTSFSSLVDPSTHNTGSLVYVGNSGLINFTFEFVNGVSNVLYVYGDTTVRAKGLSDPNIGVAPGYYQFSNNVVGEGAAKYYLNASGALLVERLAPLSTDRGVPALGDVTSTVAAGLTQKGINWLAAHH